MVIERFIHESPRAAEMRVIINRQKPQHGNRQDIRLRGFFF